MKKKKRNKSKKKINGENGENAISTGGSYRNINIGEIMAYQRQHHGSENQAAAQR